MKNKNKIPFLWPFRSQSRLKNKPNRKSAEYYEDKKFYIKNFIKPIIYLSSTGQHWELSFVLVCQQLECLIYSLWLVLCTPLSTQAFFGTHINFNNSISHKNLGDCIRIDWVHVQFVIIGLLITLNFPLFFHPI